MKNEKIIQALLKLKNFIEGKEISYCIVGSTSLYLNGIPLKASDIDVLTDKKSAFLIDEILRNYRIMQCELREGKKFRSYFGRYKIDDVIIEVMGEFQYKRKNGMWSMPITPSKIKTKEVKIEGKKIRIAEIEESYKILKEIGREKTLKIIEEWLRKRERKIKS